MRLISIVACCLFGVLPDDVRAGRWVRNVAKIELLDLRVVDEEKGR